MMRISCPVPLVSMPKEMVLQEHSYILQVAEAIQASGGVHEPDLFDEVHRWRNHVPALYDRYAQSLRYLNETLGVEVFDMWPHPPICGGGQAVYPNDSEDLVRELWVAVAVRASGLEY